MILGNMKKVVSLNSVTAFFMVHIVPPVIARSCTAFWKKIPNIHENARVHSGQSQKMSNEKTSN